MPRGRGEGAAGEAGRLSLGLPSLQEDAARSSGSVTLLSFACPHSSPAWAWHVVVDTYQEPGAGLAARDERGTAATCLETGVGAGR